MKTLDEVLKEMERKLDRPTLEDYITRQWIRPARKRSGWLFDEMDVARLRLICHLSQDIEVNEQGMDIALSLLDQLYQMRAHVKNLNHAITRQPREVQTDIFSIMKKMLDADEDM